jgi:HEAT repeat protein
MRYFSSVILVGLAVLASGCGQTQPTLAGGKAVSHWLQALQDPDAKVRKTAVTKLGNVGTADPAALPAVIGSLKDADAGVRCAAILALVKNGPVTDNTMTTLTEMQHNDRNAQVRSYAAQALEKLRSEK